MLGILLLFAVLSCGSFFGAAIGKLRYEETLPLTCTGIVAVLFAAGLCGCLAAGVLAAVGICLMLLAASCVVIIRQKSLGLVCRRFFSLGFFAFALMCVLLVLFHRGRVASQWDEFSHWMDAVKVMMTFDDFATHPLSGSHYQSYPPGMALFQYFVHQIYSFAAGSNDFAEWIVFVAFYIYTFSFVFPFLREARLSKPWPILFFFVGVILGPNVFFYSFLDCIYIDPFIGIAAGCGFAMLYLQQKSRNLYVLAVIFSLVLAKDAGLMFASFAAAALLAVNLNGRKIWQSARDRRRIIGVTAGIFAALLLPKLLWETHLTVRQAPVQFSSPIDLVKLLNVLIGRDDSYQKSVLLNYLRVILTEGFALLNDSLYLTLPVICLLLLAGMMGVHHLHSQADETKKRPGNVIIWMIGIETVVYILGLCIMYMFKFPEHEAIQLASFQRYCGIALTAAQIFLALILFSWLASKAVNWTCVLLTAIAFSLLPGSALLSFVNRSSIHEAMRIQGPYKQTAAQTLDAVGTDHKKIYIISQGSTGFDYYMLKFNLHPNTVNWEGWSISPDGMLFDGDHWTKQRSAEEWQEELKSFDYVLLNQVDETFKQHYGALFESPEEIQNQTVYQADQETGLLRPCK